MHSIMRRKFDLVFTALQVPLDFIALIGAALAAYALRFSPAFVELRPILTEINFSRYMGTAAVFSFVWLTLFALTGLYSTRPRRAWNELGWVFVAGTAGAMVLIATVFFQRNFTASRFIVLAVWALSIVFVELERLIVRVVRHALLRFRKGHRRVAIVGSGKAADELVQLYKNNPVLGFTVVRQFKNWNDDTRTDLERLANRDRVDEVLLADPTLPKETALDLIAFTEERHLGFKYLADLFAASFSRIDMDTAGGIPVIEVKRTSLDGWGRIFKRLFDMVISLMLIVIFAPIMIVIALLIKLTSRGPVFFWELPSGDTLERVGEGGHTFPYFKFRTMHEGAHALHNDPRFLREHDRVRQGPLMKIKNDPRVTPLGRMLRKFSLDELPEFFLVLRGDMSLVGPRPHLPEEVALYRPHQRRVLGIKPGITGLAQTSGRADLDFDDEVRLDTWYIEHWSPGLDLYIMLKTPFIVLARKGAY
jgi:exopolysaccharide biosynthesis polyprenyl glycosylphosphotransferase